MLQLIHYALLVLGITYLVTGAAIFYPVRRLFIGVPVLETLIYCPACFGFWVGVVMYAVWPFPELVAVRIESGLGAMVLGALWGEHGPMSPWSIEKAEEGR